jgi:hypothetical protein
VRRGSRQKLLPGGAHRLELGARLRVLRVELQQVAVGQRGALLVAAPLHHDGQVEPVVLVLGLALDGSQERPLRLDVQAFLAVSDAQQSLRLDVVVVRQHRAGEEVDGLVEVALFQGGHALFAKCAH